MFEKKSLKREIKIGFIVSFLIVVIQFLYFFHCVEVTEGWGVMSCIPILSPGIIPVIGFISVLENFPVPAGIFIICILNLIFFNLLISWVVGLWKKR
ncbi:MAG: hypothetical protein WC087_03595 [Candidatus Paceibacterota bacterium]